MKNMIAQLLVYRSCIDNGVWLHAMQIATNIKLIEADHILKGY